MGIHPVNDNHSRGELKAGERLATSGRSFRPAQDSATTYSRIHPPWKANTGTRLSLHGGVHDVDRPLAGEDAADFVGGAGLEADHRLLAVPGGVGGDDHVLAAAQWVRVGQG